MALRSARPRETFPRAPAPAAYRNIAYSFFALTVLVVLGALWLSSVRARVTVHVKSDTTSIQTQVEVAQSPEQGQLRGKVVHGIFDKSQEFSVKEQDIASAPAVAVVVNGTVKITNNYSRKQTLIQNTRLLTADGRLYRIEKTVNLDPKESALVTAHSDSAGKNNELAKGTRLTIPGLFVDIQKWIYAEAVSGFSGGAVTSKVVSQMDVETSEKSLEDAVFEQAQKTLTAEAGVEADWKGIFIKKVTEKKTNILPGKAGDSFMATVRLDVTGVFYPKVDMEALVRQKLKERLPDNRDLAGFDGSSATITLDQVDSVLQKARMSVSAEATSHLTDQSPGLKKEALLGRDAEEVRNKLMTIDGVQSVEIDIRPVWIHKIPSTADHLEVIVK